MDQFNGRLGVQQRVLPAYRASFFDDLAGACVGGLSVYAGKVHPAESIPVVDRLNFARYNPARNLHFLRVDSPLYLLWQSGITSWLDSWNPDALIVEANPRYLTTARAIRWMHARNRPVIGWGLGVPPFEAGSPSMLGLINRMSSLYRNRFLLSLDGLIAYSRRGAEEYRKAGVAGDRIFAATNAAVRRPKVAPPIRPDQITGKPVILFVGRLQRRKRVDLLMRACAKLPERLQPQVWVVGDGPARSDLERMAQVIYPQAEFPGAKRGDDLEFYFSQADLFVLPGTGGLAVQEAMAHGLPVIVAEGDGTQDDLVRAENGWQIRPGDVESLEESIREALSDLGKLRKKGLESFRIVREEANVERMVQVFVTALNSMS